VRVSSIVIDAEHVWNLELKQESILTWDILDLWC